MVLKVICSAYNKRDDTDITASEPEFGLVAVEKERRRITIMVAATDHCSSVDNYQYMSISKNHSYTLKSGIDVFRRTASQRYERVSF